MIRFAGLFLFTLSAALNVISTDLVDFYSKANRCDYLVITPRIFSDVSKELVDYRNQNTLDDVEEAHQVILENLPGYTLQEAPDSLIRNALQWAWENWTVKPRYVVLIGDDSAKFVPEDSIYKSHGPMPTHITGYIKMVDAGNGEFYKDSVLEYGDYWYKMEDTNTFAIGRIPCENSQQLSLYIDKVIRYEKTEAGLWRNRVLFFADDSVQATHPDPLGHELLVGACMNLMQNWFADYIFFNSFTGENRIKDARDAFFRAVNDNVNWVIFSCHGHPSYITDERVIGAADHIYFNNVQHPLILFSMSCSNGAFIRNVDSSMCKNFLFTPDGGAIAYIGSPNLAYSAPNELLIRSICALNDTNPQPSIGRLLTKVQNKIRSSKANEYQVLGDPAILINRNRHIDISLSQINNSIVCNISEPSFTAGSVVWQIKKKHQTEGISLIRDSIFYSDSQTVQNRSFEILVPQNIAGGTYFSLYVWNDSLEGRAGLEYYKESAVSQNDRHPKSGVSFKVSVANSRCLVFSFGSPLFGLTRVEIYQLNGQRTNVLNIPKGAETFRCDRIKIPMSGTKIVVLWVNGKIVGKKVIHLWK